MTDTLPAISIDVVARETINIRLGDDVYTVREPKRVAAEDATGRLISLILFWGRAGTVGAGAEPAPTLTADELISSAEAVWEYLHLILVDEADYSQIRQRVYGQPVDPDDLTSYRVLGRADLDKVSTDDLELKHVLDVVSQLLMRWHPEWQALAEKSTPKPAKTPQDHLPPAKKKTATSKPVVRKKTPVAKKATTRGRSA